MTTDYQQTIRVQASPDALFDALTTAAGLSAWWTDATANGDQLTFSFDPPEPLVIHVDKATRPTTVQWTVTDCGFLPDWVGTQPTFTITPLDGDTAELQFRHHGLNQELDCIDMCTRGWNHFTQSLRQYVEVGEGMPRGSTEDQARRR